MRNEDLKSLQFGLIRGQKSPRSTIIILFRLKPSIKILNGSFSSPNRTLSMNVVAMTRTVQNEHADVSNGAKINKIFKTGGEEDDDQPSKRVLQSSQSDKYKRSQKEFQNVVEFKNSDISSKEGSQSCQVLESESNHQYTKDQIHKGHAYISLARHFVELICYQ